MQNLRSVFATSMEGIRPLCARFGLDFETEIEQLAEQGPEWAELRGTELSRELRDSYGIEAVIEAVLEIAPILGFTPHPPEKLRENLLAL